eukprot:SAG11_NODE_1268_length_5342_cov_1.710853_2_plen_167_part_00
MLLPWVRCARPLRFCSPPRSSHRYAPCVGRAGGRCRHSAFLASRSGSTRTRPVRTIIFAPVSAPHATRLCGLLRRLAAALPEPGSRLWFRGRFCGGAAAVRRARRDGAARHRSGDAGGAQHRRRRAGGAERRDTTDAASPLVEFEVWRRLREPNSTQFLAIGVVGQ